MPRFVIQEHDARTHHFDLRLEAEGVLWSWALPKGLPTDSSHDRLAVRVDDHDLDHLDVIDRTPVSGAGGSIAKAIWDGGTYQVVRSNPTKLVVDLSGRRVAGRFALINTGGDQWLMHLMTHSDERAPT